MQIANQVFEYVVYINKYVCMYIHSNLIMLLAILLKITKLFVLRNIYSREIEKKFKYILILHIIWLRQ